MVEVNKWNETTNSTTCTSFLSVSEETCIHLIKTGYNEVENEYLVVWEDAYLEKTGKTELMSATDIRNKFGIIL